MTTARVLGVRVDGVTLDEAAEAVLAEVRKNRFAAGGKEEVAGSAGQGRFWLVVTPNPEIVMTARGDEELRRILNAADLAVADGVGLVWAARRLGTELPGRVAGFDLLVEVLRRGARDGLRVFLLGAKPGVAEAAAARLEADHPGLVVAGVHHGYFAPSDDLRIADLVAETRPDVVAVGMGSPRQEKWLAVYAGRLPAGRAEVGMPVGGSLDVLAGKVSRPPAWVARLNLEWAVRVASQPARWRRAPTLARFVLAVLAEQRRQGAARGRTRQG